MRLYFVNKQSYTFFIVVNYTVALGKSNLLL